MDHESILKGIFDRFWSWRLLNASEFATSIGKHLYSDRLDEMSLSSYKRREDEARSFLDEIKLVRADSSVKSLSEISSFNAELLQADLEQFVHGLQFQTCLFPLNMLEGPHLDFPRLLDWMEKKTPKNFEDIITRLRLFPQRVDELLKLLNEGIYKGITMHKVSVTVLPKTLTDMSCLTPEEAPHFKPFLEKPESFDTKEWESVVQKAKDVIEKVVLPQYKRLSDFIETTYIHHSRPEIAATSLPNGKAFYEACLKFHTTTNMSAQEIFDKGKEEVARITAKMEEVKHSVGFEGSLKEFRKYLRSDPKFKFKSKQDILDHYNKVYADILLVLPKLFARLPEAKCEIVPVPDEVAPTFPGAYYLAPPEDGSRPGTFFINTHNPTNRKKYEAVSLALHEAQPGHHLQGSLTMESGEMLAFRRFMEDRNYYEPPGRFAMNSAYVEGWGLYCEYLGEELKLYEDPYNLFGRLSHEMLRACRLVVDPGMHALGWSRQQAIDYLLENTASSEEDITSEIDRYITWPGQACGYKIGEIKIKELRSHAEKSLGDKFDIGKFHDLIASMGGVPLDILEEQINKFIAEYKR
eukprot:TCONS_00022785-protein